MRIVYSRAVFSALVMSASLFVSASLFAQQDESGQSSVSRAREFYQAGRGFMRDGNFTAANDAFLKAETILSGGGSVLLDLSPEPSMARAPAGNGGPRDASRVQPVPESAVSKALGPDIYYNLGVAALEKGDFIQAEAAFRRVVELDPGDKDACYNLGVLYEKFLDDKTRAVKYYLRYVNLAGTESPDAGRVKGWIKIIQDEARAK